MPASSPTTGPSPLERVSASIPKNLELQEKVQRMVEDLVRRRRGNLG